jgi:hypothetical protein
MRFSPEALVPVYSVEAMGIASAVMGWREVCPFLEVLAGAALTACCDLSVREFDS